ncbi:hypothetical protein V6N13_009841 [Hibiscus sabdariffa]
MNDHEVSTSGGRAWVARPREPNNGCGVSHRPGYGRLEIEWEKEDGAWILTKPESDFYDGQCRHSTSG